MSRRKIQDDEEKRRLVDEWDRSGKTAVDFATSRNIHWRTLQAWGRAIRGPLPRGRSRTRPVVTRKVKFIEVDTRPSAQSSSHPRIEVITRNGSRLLLFADWAPELVAEFMVLLEVGE